MKNLLRTSLMSCCVFACAMTIHLPTSNAQLLRRVTQKVTEKIENEANKRVDKKIDQAVNKGFDKIEQSAEQALKSKTKDENGENFASMLSQLSMGEPAKKEAYSFDLGIAYKIENASSEDKFSNESLIWYGKNGSLGIEVEQSGNLITTVMDEDQMLLFFEADKRYMAFGTGSAEGIMDAVANEVQTEVETVTSTEEEDFKLTQLRNETFLGYSCKVFLIESNSQQAKVWVTEELSLDMTKSFQNKMGSFGQSSAYEMMPKELKNLNGVLLKMESKDKNSQETTKLEATKVIETGKTIQTSKYNYSGM
jgi:hypothetical protein